MARRKDSRSKTPPKYRLHRASGQAVVSINRKAHYLGVHGTKESHQKYLRIIDEFWSKSGPVLEPAEPDDEITVEFLVVEFAKDCRRRYQKDGEPTNEWFTVQNVLKAIRGTYGDLLASEFGPVRLKSYRQSLIDRGLAKHTVKRSVGHVLRMFKHAVGNEIIPVEIYQRLLTVGPIDVEMKPAKDVKPADLKIVRETQAELTQVVSDMVEIQLLTGMRPGEVCNLRPVDIDRKSKVWVYNPPTHKTQRYGKERPILIGPKAQKILKRYLLRDEQAFCFTPSEAYEQHFDQRREDRVTPTDTGNGPKPRKQKSFNPKYDANSYRRAVHRAAMRANPVLDSADAKKWWEIYKWSPNQLRHNAATLARKEHGLETAQILLGHSSKSTTEAYYAEQDMSGAVAYAKKFG